MDAPGTLSLAFAPGVTVTKWTRIWAERYPHVPLTVIPVDLVHQVSIVLDGTAQLSFVRLPIDEDLLHVIPLYRESTVAVAAKDHVIAAADTITLEDIAGEEQHPAGMDHRDRGPFDLVASGAGVLVVPHSIARLQSRKDVVVRTITDAPETQIALVWRKDDDNATVRAELIANFIGIVRGRTAKSSRSETLAKGSARKKRRGHK